MGMQTNALFNRTSIVAILIIQFIPLILLPPSSFTPTSQEWWLPVLLLLLAAIAAAQLIFRQNVNSWPWDLIGFSQGFNIISRLMLIMPHASDNGSFNTIYVVLSIVSMLFSGFMLWYIAKPEVRANIFKN